jgi:hypothetical protein
MGVENKASRHASFFLSKSSAQLVESGTDHPLFEVFLYNIADR